MTRYQPHGCVSFLTESQISPPTLPFPRSTSIRPNMRAYVDGRLLCSEFSNTFRRTSCNFHRATHCGLMIKMIERVADVLQTAQDRRGCFMGELGGLRSPWEEYRDGIFFLSASWWKWWTQVIPLEVFLFKKPSGNYTRSNGNANKIIKKLKDRRFERHRRCFRINLLPSIRNRVTIKPGLNEQDGSQPRNIFIYQITTDEGRKLLYLYIE